jgi:hypothetical protein
MADSALKAPTLRASRPSPTAYCPLASTTSCITSTCSQNSPKPMMQHQRCMGQSLETRRLYYCCSLCTLSLAVTMQRHRQLRRSQALQG